MSDSRAVDSWRHVVTLCTGNVARSVMLAYMLTTLAEANGDAWQVRSAGTHAIEGMAVSTRTQNAMLALEDVGPHHYGAHRSHQLSGDDVRWADVVLTTEAAHVRFVREHFPEAATKTVLLAQLLREAPVDASPGEQVRLVAAKEPLADFDVRDPAGGDQAAYDACARDLWDMAQALSTMVSGD